MKFLPLDSPWLWALVLLGLALSEAPAQAAEQINPRGAEFAQVVHEEAVALGRAVRIVQSCHLDEALLSPKRHLLHRLEALLADKDVYATEDVAAWMLEGERTVSLPVVDCAARAAYLIGQRGRDESLARSLPSAD